MKVMLRYKFDITVLDDNIGMLHDRENSSINCKTLAISGDIEEVKKKLTDEIDKLYSCLKIIYNGDF